LGLLLFILNYLQDVLNEKQLAYKDKEKSIFIAKFGGFLVS